MHLARFTRVGDDFAITCSYPSHAGSADLDDRARAGASGQEGNQPLVAAEERAARTDRARIHRPEFAWDIRVSLDASTQRSVDPVVIARREIERGEGAVLETPRCLRASKQRLQRVADTLRLNALARRGVTRL